MFLGGATPRLPLCISHHVLADILHLDVSYTPLQKNHMAHRNMLIKHVTRETFLYVSHTILKHLNMFMDQKIFTHLQSNMFWEKIRLLNLLIYFFIWGSEDHFLFIWVYFNISVFLPYDYKCTGNYFVEVMLYWSIARVLIVCIQPEFTSALRRNISQLSLQITIFNTINPNLFNESNMEMEMYGMKMYV